MLETIATAAVIAFLTALLVSFLMQWKTRLELRRTQVEVDDVMSVITRETKRRAVQQSRAGRAAVLSDVDAALVQKHTGVDVQEPAAWFDRFKKP